MSTGDLLEEVLIYLGLLIDYVSYAYNTFLSIFFFKFLHQQPFRVHLPTETFHPAVLITGTSSGIGRNTALELANRGYTVFATVRKQEDDEDLKETFKRYENSKQGSLIPVIMDVTKKKDIQNAYKIIREKIGREIPFVGLINNAAHVMHLPLEVASEDVYTESFNTNYFGIVNLTKKFLPLLREGNGRVINIGSVGSWETLPSMGVYDSTKAALRAMTRAWRGSPPAIVTDAIVHALSSQYPKNTYYVGLDARMASLLNWIFGDRVIEVVLAKALTPPTESVHA
ncbi:1117_t:CDS:2 [Acaulospora colombiana]|uniref:1117_t:CDS:1 n=1 Tax=Acaulospora colombiana TaxID=27376 RepID=A0ACA9LIE6_9GLOM|nr:1117_t:CDS:2 [Acaulospora colombiana]